MKTFKDLYEKIFFKIGTNKQYCQKVKTSNFFEHIACFDESFFKINYLYTLKNTPFLDSISKINS